MATIREKAQALLNEQACNPKHRFSLVEKSLMKKGTEKFHLTGVADMAKAPPKPATAAREPASKKRKGAEQAAPAAKKTRAPKTAAPKPAAKPAIKRAADGEKDDEKDKEKPAVKKPKTRGGSTLPSINQAPTDLLNVFVFGEGSSGELGLGRIGPVIDVRRPRLNPNLLPEKAGVVQLAAGGMHVVALTHDNVLLTWGVNDQGALGRDTTYKDGDPVPHEPAKEAPADDESDDGPTVHDMNPLEAYPGAMSMENVPEGTIFTQVAAGDSSTLALTDKGHVYSCGTFRGNEGILGYNPNVKVQPTLTKLLNLKNIVKICCGDNHCLALDAKGNCFSWGSGQQNQLGRRVLERTRQQGLIPRDFGGLPKNKIAHVGAGAYHSFAVEKSGKVWAWGLNSYGNCGISTDAGDDEATIPVPTPVDTLKGKNVLNITGGSHHSLAVTADGEALVWGRLDGAQLGMDLSKLDEDDIIRDDKGLVRILSTPKPIEGVGKAVLAAIGSDTSMVLNEAGKAFTWGFSANYQTGLGTDVDVPIARMIDNTAVREKVLVWGGLGGQFGIVASVASAAKN